MEKGIRNFRWHVISRQVDGLFKTGSRDDREKARALLLEQSDLVPSHPVPLYNLACVESLLGNFLPALDYLEKSIHAGWNDLAHMQQDTDLDALRHFDHYKNLVAILEPERKLSSKEHEPIQVQQQNYPITVQQQHYPIMVQQQNYPITVQQQHYPITVQQQQHYPITVQQQQNDPITVQQQQGSFENQPSITLPLSCTVERREEIVDDELEVKLEMLSAMGFCDREKMVFVLESCGGNIDAAVAVLLNH